MFNDDLPALNHSDNASISWFNTRCKFTYLYWRNYWLSWFWIPSWRNS